MPTPIAQITADLVLRSASFMSNMEKAARATQQQTTAIRKSMRQVETAARGVNRAVGDLRTGMAALAGALAVRQFTQFARGALDAAGALKDVSDQIGFTTGQLQEMRFAAAQSGVKVNDLETALRAMQRRAGEAMRGNKTFVDAFDNLGVSVQDLRRLKPDELFLRLADGIAQMGSQARRLAAADQVFSETGRRMVVMFQDGAAGLKQFSEQARAFGAVMSEDVIARAKVAGDNLTALTMIFKTSFDTAIIKGFANSLTLTEDTMRGVQEAGRRFGEGVGAAMRAVTFAAGLVADNLREITSLIVAFAAAKTVGLIMSLTAEFVKLGKAVVAFARAQKVATFLTLLQGGVVKVVAATAAGAAAWALFSDEVEAALSPVGDAISSLTGLGDSANVVSEKVGGMLAGLRKENRNLALLTQATKQGQTAVDKLNIAFDIQDKLLDAGLIPATMSLTEVMDLVNTTTNEQVKQIAALVKGNAEYKREIDGTIDAQERSARAAEKAAEDQARLQQELADFRAEPIKNAIEDVQRTLTDTFERALDGGIDSLKDFADSFLGIVKRLAANLLAQQLVIPVMVAGAGAVGVSPEAMGLPAGLAKKGGGGLFDSIPNVPGVDVFGNGGVTSAINSFGANFGFMGGPTVLANTAGMTSAQLAALGPMGGAPTSALISAPNVGMFGTTTFSQFLGGAGAGFAAGSLVNSLLGGNQTGGMVGSAGGALAGAAIGSIIPGVGTIIGGLIGGALGGGIGGLFGNDKLPQATGTAIIGTRDGNAFLKDVLRDDLGQKEAQQFGQGVAQQLQALQQALGGEFLREFQVVSNFGENKRTTLAGAGFGKFPGTKISGDPGDIEAVIRTLLGRDDVFRIGGTEGGRIQSEVRSILSATDDLDAAITAGSFLRSVFQELPDPVTEAGKALQEFRKFIGQFSTDTEELVRSNLAGQFNDEIERAILAIVNPEQLALEQFEQMAAIRRKTAEELGADLVRLERLTALEREQILKQFGQDSSSALQAALGSVTDLSGFLQRIQFGELSPLSPQDQLALAQSQFQAVSGAALAGDFSSIQQLPQFAEPLLRAARDVLGSGTDFADVFRSVVDVIDQVAAQPADDLVQKALLAETKTQTEVLSDGLDKLSEKLDQLRQELSMGNRRPAQLQKTG